MLREQVLELLVLSVQPRLVLRHAAVGFLQSQHLVFQRLDVVFLSFTMRPLSLAIELLPSRKGWFAVRLRTSSLRLRSIGWWSC